jgi:DNA (cytosine-5)-methyltransferase 1
MKVLDLFSGIGGFSLGLERAGMETVAFCEIEPFCQKVLKKHWAHIPIYNDVTKLTKEVLENDGIREIDIITGGFPCQDLSSAGQRAGIIEGSRSSLWGEVKRLISEIRPKYAIMENVTNLLAGESGAWFGKLLSDLESVGYDAEWHCIRAARVGLPHARDRVWIIAYPSQDRREKSIFEGDSPLKGNLGEQQFFNSNFERVVAWVERQGEEQNSLRDKPMYNRSDDGFFSAMDRVGACGNAVVPQIPEIIGKAIMKAELKAWANKAVVGELAPDYLTTAPVMG